MQRLWNGTVTVRNDIVNGGDFAYLYRGKVNNNQVILTVERHNRSTASVFGDIDDLILFWISLSRNNYGLSGHVEGMQRCKSQLMLNLSGNNWIILELSNQGR